MGPFASTLLVFAQTGALWISSLLDFIPLWARVVLVYFQNISEAPGPLPVLQILSPTRWETAQPAGLEGVGVLSPRSLICETELMVVPPCVVQSHWVLWGKHSVQRLART